MTNLVEQSQLPLHYPEVCNDQFGEVLYFILKTDGGETARVTGEDDTKMIIDGGWVVDNE
uniref:Uncharacterized protein n=1 Tax=Romanomermis culicivorax TaxID=13658 RepID=A0A915JTA5_ROMCU